MSTTSTGSRNGPGVTGSGAGPAGDESRPARPTGLVTAEAVELEIPTASVGLRGLAVIVDLVVLGIVAAATFLGTTLVLGFVASVFDAAEAAVWVVIVVTLAVVFFFPAVVEALSSGRSLGKVWFKLRVVTVEAGPIGWSHALIRATAGTLELLATGGLLALLVALVSPRGQRLGDMVAGTLVVREAVSRADIRPVRFIPVAGTEDMARALDVSGLDDADYQVIRTALLRTGLPAERHADLCGAVVRGVWPRLSALPLPTTVPAPAVLTAIAAAYQDQHAPPESAAATDWVWS